MIVSKIWLVLLLSDYCMISEASGSQNDGHGVEVEVQACGGWEYGSTSNSLQIQLKGEYDASRFFFVNEFSPLPVDGRSDHYYIHDMDMMHDYYNDQLFSVVISMDDMIGFCIQGLSIGLHGKYDFYYDYFGQGIILSNYCKYSYKSISTHRPLIKCIDDYLELYTYSKRGIYKVNIHSCNNYKSLISASNMKNNFYTTIMGKRVNENVYTTTDFEYIDHYMVGNIDLDSLGHLVAGNIMVYEKSRHSEAVYTRNVTGKLIGIKLEPVDGSMNGMGGMNNNNNGNNNGNNNNGNGNSKGSGSGSRRKLGDNGNGNVLFDDRILNELKVKINHHRVKIDKCMLLGMGKYLVAFFEEHDRMRIKKDAEIIIYGNVGKIYINVYAIFEGYNELYKLPFIVVEPPEPVCPNVTVPAPPPTETNDYVDDDDYDDDDAIDNDDIDDAPGDDNDDDYDDKPGDNDNNNDGDYNKDKRDRSRDKRGGKSGKKGDRDANKRKRSRDRRGGQSGKKDNKNRSRDKRGGRSGKKDDKKDRFDSKKDKNSGNNSRRKLGSTSDFSPSFGMDSSDMDSFSKWMDSSDSGSYSFSMDGSKFMDFNSYDFYDFDDDSMNINKLMDDMPKMPEFDMPSGDYSPSCGHKGVDWFTANIQCMKKYGTFLASVHSKDEEFIMDGFIGRRKAWIGFVDWDINDLDDNFKNHNNGNNNGNNGNNKLDNNHNHYQCQWKWVDGSYIDYTHWKKGEPDNSHRHGNYDDYKDCGYIDGKKHGWKASDCLSKTKTRYICSSPYWYSNQKRKFEINIDDDGIMNMQGYIDDISIISISNYGPDRFCIDSVSINKMYDYYSDQTAVELTNNWIGATDKPSTNSLNAIFKYPVCKTEVLNMETFYDTSVSGFKTEAISVPNFECINLARVPTDGSPFCEVDQTYGIAKKSQFKIGNNNKIADYVSWGSISKVKLTDNVLITTTNEFHFDKRIGFNYVTVINDTLSVRNNIRPLTLNPGLKWYDIEPPCFHDPELMDDFTAQQWERQNPMINRCRGYGRPPPSHSLGYDLYFNKVSMIVDSNAHLKLTLCNQFLNTMNSKVLYVKDVYTQINHGESLGCNIKWKSPKYVAQSNDTASCVDEQQLALSSRYDYVPACNSNNTNWYKPCQCDPNGNNMCWCSDQYGNKQGAKIMTIVANSMEDTCGEQYLNCSYPEPEPEPTTTTTTTFAPAPGNTTTTTTSAPAPVNKTTTTTTTPIIATSVPVTTT